jgi:hypothetical protein
MIAPLNPGCGSLTWHVTGTYSSGVGTFVATSPSSSFDQCGDPASSIINATVVFAGCSAGAAKETAIVPPWTNQFGQSGPGGTAQGSGAWALATTPLTFTLSSPSQIPIPGATNNAQMIPMSTGDAPQITVTASVSGYSFTANYPVQFLANPHSTCQANLSIPSASNSTAVSSNISASPSGCSGIFNVSGSIGQSSTQNAIDVVVPPQILIQVLYGEAHGQAVSGDSVSEPAIGATIRNRLGDTVYYPGVNTYQGAITANQFNGINTSITSGTSPELSNAALIYGGVTTAAMNVANAKCFFSPDAAGWSQIRAALSNPNMTVVPTVTSDPGCFSRPSVRNEQFIYKTSIGNNANGNGAPAFIFVQRKKFSDPAVIQIP